MSTENIDFYNDGHGLLFLVRVKVFWVCPRITPIYGKRETQICSDLGGLARILFVWMWMDVGLWVMSSGLGCSGLSVEKFKS